MATTRLPADTRSAAAARDFLRDELGELYEGSLLDDALLLTSELVTNAVLHAHTGVELSVVTGMDATTGLEILHIEVADGEPTVPRPRVPGLDALGGRGLALVAALAGDWGVRLAPPGKVVWFELPAQKRKRIKPAQIKPVPR